MGQPVAFFEVTSPGRFAVFTDPDGNQVGLWA
jgi:predicted enzyme related to lactoylglutathione lyase